MTLEKVMPIVQVERSYSRQREVQVLPWLRLNRLRNQLANTAVKAWLPMLEGASEFLQIRRRTVA